MEIENQMQNHKKTPTAGLYIKMEAFDRLKIIGSDTL